MFNFIHEASGDEERMLRCMCRETVLSKPLSTSKEQRPHKLEHYWSHQCNDANIIYQRFVLGIWHHLFYVGAIPQKKGQKCHIVKTALCGQTQHPYNLQAVTLRVPMFPPTFGVILLRRAWGWLWFRAFI